MFPDGSEHLNVDVLSFDLIGDLAVIGPLKTQVEPVALTDGEDIPIGSNVFLVGYPAEGEKFPQPTITGGIVSRFRQWEAIEMTYLQTDAAIAGGQSGGALVSEKGEVIGISGLRFSEAGFGLVASAGDVLQRIRRLSTGEDVAGLGDRQVSLSGGQTEQKFMLQHRADRRTYVINEPAGTLIDVTVESENDALLGISDLFGNFLVRVDENFSGRETGSLTNQFPVPHFLHIWQYSHSPGEFQVSSSSKLVPYNDPDDGGVVTLGQTVIAVLDLPADVDHFVIDLVESDTIDITVESANFDPFIRIGYPGAREEQWVSDDNSGQGIFGLDAKLTYRAPHTGSYFIQLSDAQFADMGGYILTVSNAPPGAVPVPIPAGPELIDSPFGPMEVYESARYPLSIQHPAGWPSPPQVQIGATAQFIGEGGEQFVIAEEDLTDSGLGELTLKGYVDLVLSVVESTAPGFELVSQKQVTTAQAVPAVILDLSLFNGQVRAKRFISMYDNKIGFNASYIAAKANFSELEPVADYSFGTFRIEGLPVTQATPVPSSAPAKTVSAEDTLTIATRGLRSGAGTPSFCTAGCAETLYLSGIMETLTGVEAGPGGPLDPQSIPILAASWQLSSDLTYMDFKLKEGVQFHKGWGEMNAQDVAFTFNDANAAVNPYSIHGQAGDFAPFIKNVEVPDPYTARFNFTLFHRAMPMRYMGPLYQSAGIVPKAVFDRYGAEGMREHFIGTGPFEFVEWKKNESLVIDAVDAHWRQVPAVKQVRFLDIPESAARVAMLEVGEAQISGELPFKDVVRLQKSGFKLQRDNGYSQELSIFMAGNYWADTHPVTGRRLPRTRDTSKPWVGDPADPASMERARKVRWALAMTIDREAINQSVIEGLGDVCYLNQISVNQDGWQDKWEIPFDPQRARQLLKEAGYESGGFAVDMWIGSGGLRVELAEAIAKLWFQELGVSTNLDRITYTKYRPGLVQRTTSTFFFSAGDEGKTGFPVHWPKGMQGSAITDGGWGPGFEDPFYSQSFFKMNSETDQRKRMAMAEDYFDHVHDVMLQPCVVEHPFHPMYNPKEITSWSPHPSMNGNLSGINSLETVVLADRRPASATAAAPSPIPTGRYTAPPRMTLRPDTSYEVSFHTNIGQFKVELFPKVAPKAVNNFLFLAEQGFYDEVIFHRVIEDFMIQGGDPTGTGTSGPGYKFEDEIDGSIGFDQAGILAMANSGPDSNGSQFFITTVPTPHLNGTHTIFGRVVEGQEVVDAVSKVATDSSNRPSEPVVIILMTISTKSSEVTVSVQRPTSTPVPTATPSPAFAPVTGGPAKYGGHVIMRAYAEPKDWDPLGSSSLSSVIAYSQLYNQLVQYDTTDTGKVVCDLCSRWDITNGGKTFTFHIRENVTWHDGEALTSDDVAFSLQRYMNPGISIGRSGLFRNYTKSVEDGGVRATGLNTVEVNLRSPSAGFINFLAVDYAKILPKHLLDQFIDLNQAENVVIHNSGSGPFVLKEYQRGNFYKVSKNPNSFKEGRPFFDSIDHFVITNAARFTSAIKAGQVDMANSGGASLTPKQFLQLETDTNGEIISRIMPPAFDVGLMINVKKKPFDDPRVRQAIYLAIDRQQIDDIVLAGTSGESTIFMPGLAHTEQEALNWPGVRPKNTPGGKADLAEAKRLMVEAGLPDGFETTFDSRRISFYVPACQVVRQQLKNHLNITGELQTWDSAAGYRHFGTARDAGAEGDWALACQGEGMVVMDADAVFGSLYRIGGTRNYTDWSHPTIENLYQRQAVEQDIQKRKELLRESANFLRSFEDNHWVTLVWGSFFWPMHQDIKGFYPPKTVQYGLKHEDLWLDR